TRIRASNYLKSDPELVAGIPRVRDQGDYTNWLLDVLARDRNSLHRSAAALLARGTRYDIAKTLLAGLSSPPAEPMVDDVSDAGRAKAEAETPFDFESLAWAADTFEGYSTAEWEKLFLARTSDYRPAEKPAPLDRFTFARRRWMESSMAAPGKTAVPMPQQLIRDEVAALLRAGRWNDLDQLCRVIHFFGGRPELQDRRFPHAREPIMNLVDYAAAQAERRRSVPEGVLPTPPQATFKPEWRHPLIEQFGKEGYNVLAELETALQEKAYSDACRIITGVTAVQAVGLLPNAADSDLLVSLPGAVALAMRDHAELRNVMQREYGALAQLRLRQAAADGDVDAVQALTTQFYGTVAAAQAQMWLGDRALAQGDAARAEGCYFATRGELLATDRAAIDARLRMAAAMQGRNFGGAPTVGIALGEWTLSPADFERTIEELRKRAPQTESRSPSAVVDAGAQSTSPIPPPSRFTLKPFAKFEGEYGKNFEQLPQRDVDYMGRQIASIYVEEKGAPGKIYVSNRFQTAAFSLADGKLAWRTGLAAEQGRTYQWPLVQMPPLVDDGRVFVRRLTTQGPELACLDARDGRVLWRSPRGEVIASDPLLTTDRVQVVSLLVPQQEMLEAVLTTFELRTGKVLSRRPLVQLRDYWHGELNCKLFPAGDMLLAKIGGCVIGCGATGELRWLRRLPWIPPSVVSWPLPPELETERLSEGKFLINGSNGDSYRIDVRTGSAELYAADDVELDAQPEDWISPSQSVTHGDDWFAVHESMFGYKLWRPHMFWQSRTSGTTDAAWPTPWTKEHPAIGPIFTAGGRYFVFSAADLKSPVRDILELLPGDLLASEAPDVKNGGLPPEWRSLLPEPLRNVPPAAPWKLLQSRYDEKLWFDNKMFLQDDCRLTLALPTQPAVWTRAVGLPPNAPKVLHLRTAAAASEPWQLEVRVNDKIVLNRKIEPAAAGSDPKSQWRDEKIDLRPFAGRAVQITLSHKPIVTGPKSLSLAAWQRMEIIDP
ncbi:MAG: PQQ-like beta-propeller repeat protein, partial [Planctomycetia bacterium]|nr:PQQ-like beta-propeller repeat protein [Planctomycetia bacterium]